jgi:hypothetical protein
MGCSVCGARRQRKKHRFTRNRRERCPAPRDEQEIFIKPSAAATAFQHGEGEVI